MDEDMRVAFHECGHSLVAMIFTGKAGQVTLFKSGGGETRPRWHRDMDLHDTDDAFWLANACIAVAGQQAEAVIFGRAATSHAIDEDHVQTALGELKACAGFHDVSLDEINAVVRYLLQYEERALRGGAERIAHNETTDGARLDDRFCSRSATLTERTRSPLLSKQFFPDVARMWEGLKREAGYVPAPVPVETRRSVARPAAETRDGWWDRTTGEFIEVKDYLAGIERRKAGR